jgi:predicted nucleotidyltransferase
MIKESDRIKIIEIARGYSVRNLILFGSSIASDDPGDIDLAVGGLAPEKFFRFYGELMWQLSLPVDLVDLSTRSRFTDLIETEGTLLYESA